MNSILKMSELELDSDKSSDTSDDDFDTSDNQEINRLFPNSEHVADRQVSEKDYILHLSATLDSSPNIAVGLSNDKCELYNLSNRQLVKTATFPEHKETLVGVKFSPLDNNLLYTASSNGNIKVWDLRTPQKSVNDFLDTTTKNGAKKRTFCCFDVAPNNRLLTAGTELYQGDSFILFWDIRKSEFLGGYWESHTDDITQLKFHKNDSNRLISASTDGLINLFDLTQNSEDDALVDTFNSGCSVEKIEWFDEDISCLTHTSQVQFWKIEDADPYLQLDRPDIAKAMRRNKEEYVYVVNFHNSNNGKFILSGSNYKDGECFRSLRVHDKDLKPAHGFQENTQRVRCSWFNENINLLITGGEKSILDLWKIK